MIDLPSFSAVWEAALEDGCCPVCATGNSHTASICPDAAL